MCSSLARLGRGGDALLVPLDVVGEGPVAIAPTPDRGAYIVGSTAGANAIVTRVDAAGDASWTVSLAMNQRWLRGAIATRTSDDGVLVARITESVHGQHTTVALDALGPTGELRWSTAVEGLDAVLVAGPNASVAVVTERHVRVFDRDGRTRWERDYDATDGNVWISTVAFTPDGDLLAMGSVGGATNGYEWTADLGRGAFGATGEEYLWVARYDGLGAARWVRLSDIRSFAGSGQAIAADERGHAVIGAITRSGLDLSGNRIASEDEEESFAEKLDSCGSHLWSSPLAPTTSPTGRGPWSRRPILAVSAAGAIDFALWSGSTANRFTLAP